jgi:hypothetical protein
MNLRKSHHNMLESKKKCRDVIADNIYAANEKRNYK